MKKYLVITFLYFALISCDKKHVEAFEFVQWVNNEENGLSVTKEIGMYNFIVQYRPIEYMVMIEQRTENLDIKAFDKEKEEFVGLQYYQFKIALKEGAGDILKQISNNTSEYSNIVQYLSSAMQNDIVLMDGEQEFKCVLYHFERNYGVAPYLSFLLAFELPANEIVGSKQKDREYNDKILIYEDHIFHSGIIKLVIKGSAIEQAPKIKMHV